MLLRMNLAGFIALGHQAPELRFLVIGGYAVAAHGHTRATFDVDFLVPRADREAWTARVLAAGMTAFAKSDVFAQFIQPEDGDGFDLMFVDDATFDSLWSASEELQFAASGARVPCLDHLLALKLHALKQASAHRTSKDAEDVEMLARRNGLNLRESRYEALFLKYGTRELYETFVRILGNP